MKIKFILLIVVLFSFVLNENLVFAKKKKKAKSNKNNGVTDDKKMFDS